MQSFKKNSSSFCMEREIFNISHLLEASKECRIACLMMLWAGMMFTVTVRLNDGGFEGEKKKILLFKFLATLSAHLLHSAPHWDTYSPGDAPLPQTSSSSHHHSAAHHLMGTRTLSWQTKTSNLKDSWEIRCLHRAIFMTSQLISEQNPKSTTRHDTECCV